jgi:hypothetical protein
VCRLIGRFYICIFYIFFEKGNEMSNFIKLAVMSAFAAVSVSAVAADTTSIANTSVSWQASAVKKSDLELNVFGSTDALDFKYNPLTASFTQATNKLTVQAGGKAGAEAYAITAQLLRNTLTHAMGVAKGTLAVDVTMSGLSVTNKPVDILKGTAGKIESSVNGLQAMDLSTTGPLGTAASKFHQGIVPVEFNIESGKIGDKEYTRGDEANGLDKLADGNYDGVVELAFVASWTVGAETPENS